MVLVTVLGMFGFLFSIVYLIYLLFKRKPKKSALLIMLVSFILVIVGAMNIPADESTKQETSLSDSSKAIEENEDRKNFILLDELIDNTSTIGTNVMTYDDYQALAINGATLEGLIAQYGIPTNVIGASEGDETMQVAFPTSEDGYSADLVFEYSPGGFGDWKLSKKSVVETDGINYEKYVYNK